MKRSMQSRELLRLALRIYLKRKKGELDAAVGLLGGVELAASAIGEFQTAKAIDFLSNRLICCRKTKNGKLVWFAEHKAAA